MDPNWLDPNNGDDCMEWITMHFRIRLGLQNDVKKEMRCVRGKIVREIQQFEADVKDPNHMLGIRVGWDYIKHPVRLERFQFHNKNKDNLEVCATQVMTEIELGVEQLLDYYGKWFLRGNAPESNANSRLNLKGVSRSLNRFIRKALFSAFSCGVDDGWEDGCNMLRIILGDHPHDSHWFPYDKTDHEKRLVAEILETEEEVQLPNVLLPVMVETALERGQKFKSKLETELFCLSNLEEKFATYTKLRLRDLLQTGKVEVPKIPKKSQTSNNRSNNIIPRTRQEDVSDCVWECVRTLYRLGHHCGFQQGQYAVKGDYGKGGNFVDGKYYTLLSSKRQDDWIVIDTSSPSPCNCGQCFKCIQDKYSEESMAERFAKHEGTTKRSLIEMSESIKKNRKLDKS